MDKRLYLAPSEAYPLTELSDVPLVRVPMVEHSPLPFIKKRAVVAEGALIATHTSPNIGDLHAPFTGTVKDLTSQYIAIEALPEEKSDLPPAVSGTASASAAAAGQAFADGPEQNPEAETAAEDAAKAAPATAAPMGGGRFNQASVSFDGLNREELAVILKSLGVSVRQFARRSRMFVINALNPEPGMLYTQELLASYRHTLEAGLGLLKRLSGSEEYVLVLPEGSPHTLEGTTPRYVKPVYPISLTRPLALKLTGKEYTGNITVVRLHALFSLGMVAQSGMPLTRILTTALGRNYLAPLGTPVETFFAVAGTAPEEGDTVIIGGAMRGTAIANLSRGLGKMDEAVLLARKGTRPALEDNPCIGCGACVRVCPMRLRPNMLSRLAEFEQYEACRKEHIDACTECGMCGYVCPTCRPMQQYFRIAKFRLGIRSFQHTQGI
jgi:electron transport complex protein RnfC